MLSKPKTFCFTEWDMRVWTRDKYLGGERRDLPAAQLNKLGILGSEPPPALLYWESTESKIPPFFPRDKHPFHVLMLGD